MRNGIMSLGICSWIILGIGCFNLTMNSLRHIDVY
jgi:hypothetical protein